MFFYYKEVDRKNNDWYSVLAGGKKWEIVGELVESG
jgi:hypothetical protein